MASRNRMLLGKKTNVPLGLSLLAIIANKSGKILNIMKSKKCGSISGRFSLYQLPMEKLTELPERNFDVITSSFAFHYIEDFPALLASIANKLKPNGTLVFPKSIRLQLAIKKGSAGKKMRKSSKSLIV